MQRISDAKGSLIYTAEGAVSVQVMFPRAQAAPSNAPVKYAQDGYEASFGRYVVTVRVALHPSTAAASR